LENKAVYFFILGLVGVLTFQIYNFPVDGKWTFFVVCAKWSISSWICQFLVEFSPMSLDYFRPRDYSGSSY